MAKAGKRMQFWAPQQQQARADTSATTLQRVLSETLAVKLTYSNFDVKSVKTLKLWEMAEAKNDGRIFLSEKS